MSADRDTVAPRLPRVVVLAGGFGTRVRHLLPDVPKPLAPVAGRPFVEWVVRFYARHGAIEFTISTGYLAGKIAAHFASRPVAGVRVRCCPETEPLGTAGGFLNCIAQGARSEDRWLVVNGDSLAFADPEPLIRSIVTGVADAAVLGLVIQDASRYGSLDCDRNGRLVRFAEKRPGAGVINAGMYAFSRRALADVPSLRPLSFEVDVFPRLAQTGRAAVVSTTAEFLDIGTPASLALAERFIHDNLHEFEP